MAYEDKRRNSGKKQSFDRSRDPRPANRPSRPARPRPAPVKQPVQPVYSPAEEETESDALNIVEGRNAVHEAIASGRSVEKLFVLGTTDDTRLNGLVGECKENGAQIIRCDRHKLDAMSRTGAHQGAIAVVSEIAYATVDDIFARAEETGRPPLIVVCDHLSDPQNLGAIVRSAEVFGAHGVIIPKRRSVSVTPVTVKASAGACLHLPIVRCTNLHAVLTELKERGVWICGADGSGDRLISETDLTSPTAIVLGSEGDGMARLTKDDCDFVVRIPMQGKVNSLNVSAAAAVFLYEAIRQRGAKESL